MEFSLLYLPSCKTVQLKVPAIDSNYYVTNLLKEQQLSVDDFYVVCNGRLASISDVVLGGCCYRIQPRLCGGKGGFGSMLRALGAQIEKTTNREACRDLSGRRMRDVNNEKKLREWAAKAGEREKAREERRKERRERLKAGAIRHKFSDPGYDQQKTRISEELDEALREALKKSDDPVSSTGAVASSSKGKRKAPSATVTDSKKACDWIGIDVDLSSSSSNASSDEEMDDKGQSFIVGDEHSSSSSSSSDSSRNKLPETSDERKPTSSCDSTGSNDADTNGATSTTVSSKHSSKLTESFPQSFNEPSSKEDRSSTDNAELQLLDLDECESAKALEKFGLDVLKAALTERGLKCGGTLEQRAQRLFSVKGLSVDQIDKSLFAKPVGKK